MVIQTHNNMSVLFVLLFTAGVEAYSPYIFFDLQDQMDSVNAQNCHLKTKNELHLNFSTLAYVPSYLDGASDDPFNSLLKEAARTALNRAFFYSFINQKLNRTSDFPKQPDLVYNYLSSVSSTTASSDGIVGTGIYYDQNTSYPNWYTHMPFNTTVNLFAPYAMKSTNVSSSSVNVEDDSVRNYTKHTSKTSDWFRLWVPDHDASLDQFNKAPYSVVVSERDKSLSYFSFYATSNSYINDTLEPVRFTAPYFDCGRTNKWIVTAVAPVTDYLARYTDPALARYIHRRPRFVAEATVDIDFSKIDINQCPTGYYYKDRPNAFTNTDNCMTGTQCRPLRGYGFIDGAYECVCKPGYTYKNNSRTTPYTGIEILNSPVIDSIHLKFTCVKIEGVVIGKRKTASTMDPSDPDTNSLAQIQNSISKQCTKTSTGVIRNLLRPSDNLTEHYQPQAREALRLAHFLSNYLQTPFTPDPDSDLKARHPLNQDQLQGEAVAIALSDPKISAVNAYVSFNGSEDILETYVFKNRTSDGKIGPFEFELVSGELPTTDADFRMKSNQTMYWLETVTVDPKMKKTPDAATLSQMTQWVYKVPSLKTGQWGSLNYNCHLKQWQLMCTIPVIGSTDDGDSSKVRGSVAVTVNVPPSLLSM